MTFIRPTLSELITRATADFDARMPGADSRVRRSFLDVLARVHSGAAHGLYGYLSWLALQLMPDTAEAEYLDRWSTIWGVARKAAAPAMGTIALTGVNNAVVSAGALLARSDGTRFRTLDAAVIAGGVATVQVEAVDGGAAGVTAPGAQLTFISPVSGVGAIAIATDGLVGGADEESDAQLLARLLTRIRTPPQGGAASDWTSWALEVPGVTRAWTYPNWMGPGTVGLTFVLDGRDDILPTEADLDAVAAYVEPRRPVTATPIVFAPTPQPVTLLIGLTPDEPAVRAAIVAELADLFFREAQPGGTLYLSRIREAISQAAGEFDHVLYSPAANIVAEPGFFPMLEDVLWQ
ncbi:MULTISPECIES: baseplate J/gp47 family protein [unclassified Sphingomonas]|uniref:baseplate J/gp47 family protein n=1 Tax=unclassified Sphingomonas TaxID=196159 RepID=UPI0008364328|nr:MULTISPECIES: baseplate J/gp47 family protein [unclassified Sphingomonas]